MLPDSKLKAFANLSAGSTTGFLRFADLKMLQNSKDKRVLIGGDDDL
jgi:hypothetical protein